MAQRGWVSVVGMSAMLEPHLLLGLLPTIVMGETLPFPLLLN